MLNFTITRDAEFQGATVIFPDGSTRTIGADNPNYQKVVDGIFPTQTLTDDEVLNLIAPFEAIYKTLTKLSERVSRKGSKLLFDGDVVSGKLGSFIIDLMNEGKEESWKAYIAFMEKLYTNPSETSREHLFYFIEANGLQVTPDGDIVLYKGTEVSGLSSRSGYGIVNGVEVENGQLQNSLGAVIEIPRNMVDDDRGRTCSVGLHVGAYEYVVGTYRNQWPRLWTVLVNPRDVVAVPHDFKSSKIRVTRYVVVEDNTGNVKHEGLVWEAPKVEAEKPKPQVKLPEGAETRPTIKVDVSKRKVVTPTAGGSRVAEYKKVIQALIDQDPNANLKRYRSKKVTAARRAEFEQAANELGFKL
ncbi:rIIB-like protein [Microbacterium phage Big4]|nr:rIIB-like protein [Microbacterium phage Big4]